MGIFDGITKTLTDNPLASLGMGTSALGGIMSLFGDQTGSNQDEAINLLKQSLAAAKEGFTDAQGNRISYVPGKGWVTQMADKTATAQDANNIHNKMQMASENTQAAKGLRNLSSVDIKNILSNANLEGNKAALDKSTSSAMRTAGTGSNIGSIISGLNQGANENIADTESNALIESLLGGGNINTARTAPYIANSEALSSPFKNAESTMNAMMPNFANMANANTLAVANATATKDPNTSFASKFGSTLEGLGMGMTDLNKTYQNKKQTQVMGDFLKNFKAGSW